MSRQRATDCSASIAGGRSLCCCWSAPPRRTAVITPLAVEVFGPLPAVLLLPPAGARD